MDREKLQSLGLWEGGFCRFTQGISRGFFRWVLRNYCTLAIRHADRLEGLQQCLWAPTHASHLDFWAVLEGVPGALAAQTYVAAARDYFYDTAWRRLVMRLVSFHNFAFTRDQVSPTEFRRLIRILQEGYSLLMFPQGSRSRDNKRAPLKPLMAMIAIESRLPLVPVIVKGTFEALPAGRCWPRRHPVSVVFGNPLYPDQVLADCREKVWHKRAQVLNQRLTQALDELGQSET